MLRYPGRVLQVLADDYSFYPVTAHIGLMAGCNHDCIWCSDIEYRRKYSGYADPGVFLAELSAMKDAGLASVNWTGSGEPTYHPMYETFADHAYSIGLLQSCITNGSRLDKIDPNKFKWVRVSLDAGTRETHARLHRTDDFDTILHGMADFKQRTEAGGSVLGVSFLVTKDNVSEVPALVATLDSYGVDYIRIKEATVNAAGNLKKGEKRFLPTTDDWQARVDRSEMPSTTHIQVHYDEERGGGNAGLPCYANSFHTFIAPSGDVFLCCRLTNTGRDEESHLGNIKDGGFSAVWASPRRAEVVARFLDPKVTRGCPTCSLTRFNQALHGLKSDPVDQAGFLFI